MKNFVIAFLLLTSLVSAETIDFGNCKTVQIWNSSCAAINCTQPWYTTDYCAPSFPKINRNDVLTRAHPILIYPDYNYSIKIDEAIFSEASITLTNQQALIDMQRNITALSNYLDLKVKSIEDSFTGINKHINDQDASLRIDMINETQSIRGQLIDLQNAASKKGTGVEIWAILIACISIAGVYLAIKAGYIKPMKRVPEEWEGSEPTDNEKDAVRKRRPVKK